MYLCLDIDGFAVHTKFINMTLNRFSGPLIYSETSQNWLDRTDMSSFIPLSFGCSKPTSKLCLRCLGSPKLLLLAKIHFNSNSCTPKYRVQRWNSYFLSRKWFQKKKRPVRYGTRYVLIYNAHPYGHFGITRSASAPFYVQGTGGEANFGAYPSRKDS